MAANNYDVATIVERAAERAAERALERLTQSRTVVPVPDPTALTTDQLRRELTSLREYLLSELAKTTEVHAEKFGAIELSIGKNEFGTTKQLDALDAKVQNVNKILDDKINDVKDRISRREARGAGISEGWGYLVGLLGLAVGLGVLLIDLMRTH